MQEPHIEGLDPRDDPEPCIDSDREGAGEASAGARPGPVWSRDIAYSRAPTPLSEVEGHTDRARQGERSAGPARSETRGTGGTFLRENREIPVLPGAEAPRAAEEMEGRSLAKGNAGGQIALRTLGRGSASSALDRVREAAKRDKGQRFDAAPDQHLRRCGLGRALRSAGGPRRDRQPLERAGRDQAPRRAHGATGQGEAGRGRDEPVPERTGLSEGGR